MEGLIMAGVASVGLGVLAVLPEAADEPGAETKEITEILRMLEDKDAQLRKRAVHVVASLSLLLEADAFARLCKSVSKDTMGVVRAAAARLTQEGQVPAGTAAQANQATAEAAAEVTMLKLVVTDMQATIDHITRESTDERRRSEEEQKSVKSELQQAQEQMKKCSEEADILKKEREAEIHKAEEQAKRLEQDQNRMQFQLQQTQEQMKRCSEEAELLKKEREAEMRKAEEQAKQVAEEDRRRLEEAVTGQARTLQENHEQHERWREEHMATFRQAQDESAAKTTALEQEREICRAELSDTKQRLAEALAGQEATEQELAAKAAAERAAEERKAQEAQALLGRLRKRAEEAQEAEAARKVEPKVNLETEEVDFGHLVLRQRATKSLKFSNVCAVPVKWRLNPVGEEGVPETFTIDAMEGSLDAGEERNVAVTFRAEEPESYTFSLCLQVGDNEDLRPLADTGYVEVKAEAFGVDVLRDFPIDTKLTQLESGGYELSGVCKLTGKTFSAQGVATKPFRNHDKCLKRMLTHAGELEKNASGRWDWHRGDEEMTFTWIEYKKIKTR